MVYDSMDSDYTDSDYTDSGSLEFNQLDDERVDEDSEDEDSMDDHSKNNRVVEENQDSNHPERRIIEENVHKEDPRSHGFPTSNSLNRCPGSWRSEDTCSICGTKSRPEETINACMYHLQQSKERGCRRCKELCDASWLVACSLCPAISVSICVELPRLTCRCDCDQSFSMVFHDESKSKPFRII
jgi:hypothetical protein